MQRETTRLSPSKELLQTLLDLNVEKDEEGNIAKAYRRKEGKIDGECLFLYPSGEVKGRVFYRQGELHGPSCFYSKEGTLVSCTYFEKGLAIGESKQFYRSGKLYAKVFYTNGILDGKQEYFYEDGKIKTTLTYENGKIEGEVLLFWPSGQLKRQTFFLFGVKNGVEKILSEEGIVLDEGEFFQGKPIGAHTRRYLNGHLKEEKKYFAQKCTETKRWDEAKRLEFEGIHIDDTTFQETKFYPDGTKQVRQGVWDGERCHWK